MVTSFHHYHPTSLFFGSGCLQTANEDICKAGNSFLIITGKSSSFNGSLRDLTAILQGKKVAIYNRCPENPPMVEMENILETHGRSWDSIIGLGGGSPMDAAKAIAIACANPGRTIEDLWKGGKLNPAIPVIAIPTTSGTGSEVTPFSVLTKDGMKYALRQDELFPVLAAVDPDYTFQMPWPVTLSTGLDALAHAMEGYISLRANPITDFLAIEAIHQIRTALPELKKNPENPTARAVMSQASVYAGIVISQASTTLGHPMGYHVTGHFGIPHGLATAFFLPWEMDSTDSEKAGTVRSLFPESIDSFLNQLGVSKYLPGVPCEQLESWVDSIEKVQHHQWMPGKFSRDSIREGFQRALGKSRLNSPS